MSGHSKWHNIKLKKGKVDAQRGALFTKLSKEIILAAKGGSPDPEANYRLKMAVEKAREFNMPQENIKRAIARGIRPERRARDRGDPLRRLRSARPRRRRRCCDRQSQPHRRRTALSFQPPRGQPRRERQRRLDVRRRSAWSKLDPGGQIRRSADGRSAGRRRRGHRVRRRLRDDLHAAGACSPSVRDALRATRTEDLRRVSRHAREDEARAAGRASFPPRSHFSRRSKSTKTCSASSATSI